ncbi:hypothetical protein NB694_000765 [Pantoea ananatis]|nr:hypothetical protein [Pantoea ananatis]
MNGEKRGEGGVDRHIRHHPTDRASKCAGHVFQDLAGATTNQGKADHHHGQTWHLATFNLSYCDGFTTNDDIGGNIVTHGSITGGFILCAHRRLAIDEDAFRSLRQILRCAVLFTGHFVLFQRRGARVGGGYRGLPHCTAKLAHRREQHAAIVCETLGRLRLRWRRISGRKHPGCACS